LLNYTFPKQEIASVNKLVRISSMGFAIVLGLASTALAQEPAPAASLILAGGAVGVGLTVMGAAFGIGRLAASAVESMARQPEVASSIQTAMIIAAALIEGFTFFALVICMLYAF
jgi:F-type H+-transporting ATPase subunit c